MAPIEILAGRPLSKDLKDQIGENPVVGIIAWREQGPEPFTADSEIETLHHTIEALLERKSSKTFLEPGGKRQEEWLRERKEAQEKWGEHGLTAIEQAFPERGHTQVTAIIHALHRAQIKTVEDLLNSRERAFGTRGIDWGGSTKMGFRKTLLTKIIDFFEAKASGKT